MSADDKELVASLRRSDPLKDEALPDPRRSMTRTVSISRTYRTSGAVTKEDSSDELMEVRVPPPGVPLAQVGVSGRVTINTGNYQSVQIGVDLTLPSPVEELEDAYTFAKKFVDDRLGKEAAGIRAAIKERD